ncbi:DUF4837 family protein [Flammeovirga sp. SubArs3]|uniref:DUF4837 family protein n=1 Tax=Flammeovirga sp. SubArs3 TaxID=2995316 RepID=UPI00248D17FD|nr:DUF4837 family protein [Flammeovirga sp. SubArs3]
MKQLRVTILVLMGFLSSGLLFSCQDNQGASSNLEKSFLPSSKGKPGEMVLVIDSNQWNKKGSVGQLLYETVLGKTRGILPQNEPSFTVTQVQPSGFNNILRQARNVLIVTTFDKKNRESKVVNSFFGEGVIKSLLKEEDKYFFIKQDVWAKDQTVMLFFAKDEATMREILANPSKQYYLGEPFHEVETKRLQKTLQKEYDRNTERYLKENYKVSIHTMPGFKVAQSDKDFLWLRHPELSFDNNIFFVKFPYTDEKQFDPDYVLNLRDKLAKQYLYGDPSNQNSFVLTEDKIAPEVRSTKINGKQAMEIRGLWKTNNLSMGGPFVGYLFPDNSGANLYYAEGFVFAPGMDKRELMREMEAELKTFKDLN